MKQQGEVDKEKTESGKGEGSSTARQKGGAGAGVVVSSPPNTQRLAPEKQHNVVFFVVFFLKNCVYCAVCLETRLGRDGQHMHSPRQLVHLCKHKQERILNFSLAQTFFFFLNRHLFSNVVWWNEMKCNCVRTFGKKNRAARNDERDLIPSNQMWDTMPVLKGSLVFDAISS